jgi:hypothetical protein
MGFESDQRVGGNRYRGLCGLAKREARESSVSDLKQMSDRGRGRRRRAHLEHGRRSARIVRHEKDRAVSMGVSR